MGYYDQTPEEFEAWCARRRGVWKAFGFERNSIETRAANCLTDMGVLTPADLVRLVQEKAPGPPETLGERTWWLLLRHRNIGKKVAEVIISRATPRIG